MVHPEEIPQEMSNLVRFSSVLGCGVFVLTSTVGHFWAAGHADPPVSVVLH